jgi:RimJ/RimL family protein N-acetyltransferase
MQHLTSRLILRPPVRDDLARLLQIYGDQATNQFNPSGPLRSISQASALLERWLSHWATVGYGQWAISTQAEPDHVIGFGGIDTRAYLDEERMNLGYRFGVEAWGQGYATELGHAALAYGFEALCAPAIFAVVRPAHAASIRVLRKVGMLHTGDLDDVPGGAPSWVFTAHPDKG